MSRNLSFSALLAHAVRICNKRGRDIAILVLVFGTSLAVIEATMWNSVLTALQQSADATMGHEAVVRLQEHWTSTAAPERFNASVNFLADELSKRVTNLTREEEEQALMVMLWQLMKPPLMVAVPFIVLHLFLALLLRACTLVWFAGRAALHTSWFHRAALVAGVMSSWVLALFVSGGWLLALLVVLSFFSPMGYLLTFLAMIVPLLLWPRLAFAPVILAHNECSVLESLRLSYRHTQGSWWLIITQLFWFSLFVWCARSVYTGLIEGVVSIAAKHSPYASLLYSVLPFLAVIFIIIKLTFVILLWQVLPGKMLLSQLAERDQELPK